MLGKYSTVLLAIRPNELSTPKAALQRQSERSFADNSQNLDQARRCSRIADKTRQSERMTIHFKIKEDNESIYL